MRTSGYMLLVAGYIWPVQKPSYEDSGFLRAYSPNLLLLSVGVLLEIGENETIIGRCGSQIHSLKCSDLRWLFVRRLGGLGA